MTPGTRIRVVSRLRAAAALRGLVGTVLQLEDGGGVQVWFRGGHAAVVPVEWVTEVGE